MIPDAGPVEEGERPRCKSDVVLEIGAVDMGARDIGISQVSSTL